MPKLTRFRVKKDRDYTTIHNQIFRNDKISLKAKGFFAVIMTLSDDWDFSVNGIVRICRESKHTVYKIIAELESFGYIRRKQERKGGKITEWVYDFTEVANSFDLLPTFQEVEKQEQEKRTQLSTKEELSTNGIKYQRNEDSVPTERASAAKQVIDFGVSIFASANVPDQPARSLIGKLRQTVKGNDDEAMRLLRILDKEHAADPKAFLMKLINNYTPPPAVSTKEATMAEIRRLIDEEDRESSGNGAGRTVDPGMESPRPIGNPANSHSVAQAA